MKNWLAQRAYLSPEKLALNYGGDKLTFKELDDRAREMAYKLAGLGLNKGEKVAVFANNSLKLVVLIHALEYLGAVMVFINTRLGVDEISYQISDSDSVCLIYDNQIEDKVNLDSLNIISKPLEELEMLPGQEVQLQEEVELSRPHTIIYTSGTTGTPKGVVLTNGNHWWNAVGSALKLGVGESDSWLLTLPIFHVGGLSILIRSLVSGFGVVLGKSKKSIDLNRLVEAEKITFFSAVSIILDGMISEIENKGQLSSLRCVLLGGGVIPKALLEKARAFEIPVYQTYGMTETASQFSTLSEEHLVSKAGSAGKVLFPNQLRIVNAERDLSPGEVGEILVKGLSVMKGYYKRQEATEESFRDEWFVTGDLGYLDEEGFLYIVDRRDDMLISGGENVYPAEIEAVLLEHPDVEEAGVTGMEDEWWGKVPVALVKLKSESLIEEEDLKGFCQNRLAKYKIPKTIRFVESLPRNATGKLLRRELLKRPEEGAI